MPVLFLNTESVLEGGQLASQFGAVEEEPTSFCTTAPPVKLVSLATATSPAANLDTQSVPPTLVTVVFESISNGVTPPSAACAGDAGDAASVIATGVASAAAKTRRRCLARDTCR